MQETLANFAKLKSQFHDASKLVSDYKVLYDRLSEEIAKSENKIHKINEIKDEAFTKFDSVVEDAISKIEKHVDEILPVKRMKH